MLKQRLGTATILSLLAFFFLFSTIDARRKHDRRSDIENVPPIGQYGWKVPLDSGEICEENTLCIQSLPAPSVNSELQYLAIGRGTVTYSCIGQPGRAQPIYIGENAFIYDVAAIIPKFTSEEQFHSFIPRFLEYDYTSLENSTLNCIGNVQKINGLTVFTLYHVDAFTVGLKDQVNSPHNRQFDLPWTFSQDDDAEWSIYRVETAGGGPPYNCGDQLISQEIPVEYVAEYWFYRRTANGHDGSSLA